MSTATLEQGKHTLQLISDQDLDLDGMKLLHLYLPALAGGVKSGKLPSLDVFRGICEGRIDPKVIPPKWTEKDGVIYFTLPATDGCTGLGWKERLKSQGKRLSSNAEIVLDSDSFKPTTGVVYRNVALRATFWKTDAERTTKAIRAEGVSRKWHELEPEAVCLIREYFSDDELREMGLLYILGIHEPVEVGGGPLFLGSFRSGGGRWLDADWAGPGSGWGDGGAFAWSLSQVKN